ncbi:gamma-glutamyl-gamma-aminobutyrate hydrolase family protein [Kitasatospora sp. GP82]|uniref:gamma-glutamyl-gamma-aminobutyrate hydrolase family protein n=1 Tax=Kitasatospora sp. GP82 TaxID=3035089 RepID=UPI002476291F|nr:gamma-glutamyl-gamma-aminobutyrate hydrolase family protein [Kitasatospora sp. GP82]MDH6127033.1 putative glutamine amidotransferase [Kitasatospora sp. GP82]
MTTKPVIGITTHLTEAVWDSWGTQRAVLLSARYPAMIQAAGGVAFLLPPDAPQRAPGALTRLDALVVSGGPDLHPAYYGAQPHPRTRAVTPERDAWETALLHAAVAAEMPLLGICRGMQLLNVVFGGTLIQHLDHVQEHLGTPQGYGRHPVRPVPGTLLAELLPETVVSVPTYHHQAVDRLGTGLIVSAYAEDGTVEAVEGSGFTLGVQWHPEQGEDLRLLEALVGAAAAARVEGRVAELVPLSE